MKSPQFSSEMQNNYFSLFLSYCLSITCQTHSSASFLPHSLMKQRNRARDRNARCKHLTSSVIEVDARSAHGSLSSQIQTPCPAHPYSIILTPLKYQGHFTWWDSPIMCGAGKGKQNWEEARLLTGRRVVWRTTNICCSGRATSGKT